MCIRDSQGAVNKDRGIELMIQAMNYIDAQLYIVGGGDLWEKMIQCVEKLELQNDSSYRIPPQNKAYSIFG